MRPEEKVIREKRIIEATKKNMMGTSGKLGMIARHLGHPMIQQGFIDFFEEMEEIQESDGAHCQQIGWVFDGLPWGMHLEIQLNADVMNGEIIDYQSMKVYYKGYEVYKEESGELETYAPFDDWESLIDKLYKNALRKQEKEHDELFPIMEQRNDMAKKSFFQRLRYKWGF
jgi:hypothetical protein